MSDEASWDDDVRRLARAVEANLSAHPDAEALVAHQRGDLPQAEADALEEHLAWCRDCASLYRDVPWFFEEEAEPSDPAERAAAWSALEARLEEEEPPVAAHPVRRRTTGFRLMSGLAAALAVVLGGAVYWMVQMHGRVDELGRPRGNVPIRDLAPEGAERTPEQGPPTVSLERGAQLVLDTSSDLAAGSYLAEIEEQDGRVLWRIDGLRPTDYGTLTLALPPGALPPGLYRIVVRGEGGAPEVGHYTLRVVEAPAPPPAP
jgi:hypothetical protein